jgi:tetratricopeptide (TPR) repeat protein
VPLVYVILFPWLMIGWIVYRVGVGLEARLHNVIVDSVAIADRARALALQWVQEDRIRHLRNLALGLPSLIVLGGIGIASVPAIRPAKSIESEYRSAAVRALHAREYALADLCLARATELGGGTADVRFTQARIAEAAGETLRCQAIMSALAPTDRDGFGPAHIWMAEQALSNRPCDRSELAIAENHWQRAIRLLPRLTYLHDRLGQVYLDWGKTRRAADELARSIALDPGRALMVAQLYANCGQANEAARLATRAIEYWTSRLADDAGDHQARLHLSGALLFSRRFADAVDCLEASPMRDAELSHALAEVLVAWASSLRAREGSDDHVADLLARALAGERFNLSAIDRLARWREESGPGSRRLQRAFDKLRLDRAPADVFLILAQVDLDRHRRLAARTHLERAHALAPDSIAAANNLALLLSQLDGVETSRALRLVDHTHMSPGSHRATLLETRADVYMRLDRWSEAFADLQVAIESAPADPKRQSNLLLGVGRYLARCCVGPSADRLAAGISAPTAP